MNNKKLKKMNNNNLKLKGKFLTLLAKFPKEHISHIIDHLDDNSIEMICECVYNAIYTDLSISKKKKKNLRKRLHKHCCMKNLKTITTPSITVSKKRKALKQEGTGLGFILSTIVPLITKLFV